MQATNGTILPDDLILLEFAVLSDARTLLFFPPLMVENTSSASISLDSTEEKIYKLT